MPLPQAPEGTGRWLWYDVKPVSPDVFEEQRIAEWEWAETVQGAFRKGQQDEADEQRQREHEQRKAEQRRQADKDRERALVERGT